jgi:PPOX class probable F420-dependent enzyme
MWTLTALCLLGLAVASVATPLPPDVVEALKTSKNLYVATKRKDGTESKKAPIWFMYDGDAVYFTTAPESYKAKRIAKGSPIFVWVGAENGPHFVGKAEIVRDPEVAARMAPAYDQKYWISWVGFFRPRPDRVRDGKTVIVKVTP